MFQTKKWSLILCGVVVLLGAATAAVKYKSARLLLNNGSTTPANWTGEFPPEFFLGKDEQKLANNALIGKPAPPLNLTEWMNGSGTPDDRKGKIVLVDFWATWCPDCMKAMPITNALYQKYKDRGVLVIGACSSDQGQEKMAEVAKQLMVAYPVGCDPTLATDKAWNVKRWPTYGVIDRNGQLRALGLKDEHVEEVIQKLLGEQPA